MADTRWRPIGLQEWDSSSKVRWTAETLWRCDPYLVWWDASSGSDPEPKPEPASNTRPTYVTVLIEKRPGHDGPTANVPPEVKPTHLGSLFDPTKPSQAKRYPAFGSYRVPRNQLGMLVDMVAKDSGWVRRFELSLAHRDLDALRGPNGFNSELLLNFLPAQVAGAPAVPFVAPQSAGGPLVGIIDDGCNFLSRWQQTPTGPAVHALWDQGMEAERVAHLGSLGLDGPDDYDQVLPEPNPTAFRYGREYVVTRRQAPDPDEHHTYAYLGHLFPAPRWGHGQMVLDLVTRPIVTRGVVMQSEPRPSQQGVKVPEVVFVQLPRRTVNDTSGGSLASHALDGILHVLHRRGADPQRPAIVNLSYGTHAGPHDGTSLFERALKWLLEEHENLHVVIPAGNTHLSRTHASSSIAPRKEMKLEWKIHADDTSDSFCELWLERPQGIVVTMRSPGGQETSVAAGEAAYLSTVGGLPRLAPRDEQTHAAIVFPTEVAQGENGTMVLLAVGPTRFVEPELPQKVPLTSDPPIPGFPSLLPYKTNLFNRATASIRRPVWASPGVWSIRIANTSTSAVNVHAWIQRDDVAPGSFRGATGFRGRQSAFLVPSDGDEHPVEPGTTLNGIATGTHSRLHVVGAMRAMDEGLSAYSAAGPNRLTTERSEGPDEVVYADLSIEQPGLLVTGTLSGSALRVSGTSVAAAAYTRRLYEDLSSGGSGARRRASGERPLDPDRPMRAAGAPERAGSHLRGEDVRRD